CALPLFGGAAGLDADRTRQRAVFEVIERRSARRPGALAVRGCATDLSGAVETARLLPFTDEQYATPGFPYVAVDDHTGLTWAEGDDLAGRTRALVPLDLVALGPARDL